MGTENKTIFAQEGRFRKPRSSEGTHDTYQDYKRLRVACICAECTDGQGNKRAGRQPSHYLAWTCDIKKNNLNIAASTSQANTGKWALLGLCDTYAVIATLTIQVRRYYFVNWLVVDRKKISMKRSWWLTVSDIFLEEILHSLVLPYWMCEFGAFLCLISVYLWISLGLSHYYSVMFNRPTN